MLVNAVIRVWRRLYAIYEYMSYSVWALDKALLGQFDAERC